MPRYSPPKPPRGLAAAGKKFWNETAARVQIVEPHHAELLASACRQLDVAADAKAEIKKSGVLVQDRFKQWKENPAVAIERQAMNAFRLLIREMGLDLAGDTVEHRGPRLGRRD